MTSGLMDELPFYITEVALSPTERTPIVIQLCLRSQIGLWGNINTHYLISSTIFLPMWGLQILLFGEPDN